MAHQDESRVGHVRETWEEALVEARALQQAAAETIAQRKAMQLDPERQCSTGWEAIRLIHQRMAQTPGATTRSQVPPTSAS